MFVVYAGAGDVPPLAGTYAIERGALVFHPPYPLASGVSYRAVFRGAGAPIEQTFDGPARSARRRRESITSIRRRTSFRATSCGSISTSQRR